MDATDVPWGFGLNANLSGYLKQPSSVFNARAACAGIWNQVNFQSQEEEERARDTETLTLNTIA